MISVDDPIRIRNPNSHFFGCAGAVKESWKAYGEIYYRVRVEVPDCEFWTGEVKHVGLMVIPVVVGEFEIERVK